MGSCCESAAAVAGGEEKGRTPALGVHSLLLQLSAQLSSFNTRLHVLVFIEALISRLQD